VSAADITEQLEPRLAKWFRRKFQEPTPVQQEAVGHVLAGRSVLISSPTGSGKTLAAFLGVFDYLLRLEKEKRLPHGVVAVYVSPLRALAYDLQKNISQPLRALRLHEKIRIGLRTGDTSIKERAAQRRKPPHILVTTPESLALLLSQEAWATALAHRRFLIVDEIHALAENKRGTHLMVSAERLAALSPEPMRRVGLSATIAPLETVGEFLSGSSGRAEIVTSRAIKKMIIEVFSPLRKNPYPPAGYTATRVLKELAELLKAFRTTLIFTNTRSGAESIGLQLKELMPREKKRIEVHHASLDRQIRLDVEDRLKQGKLRAVVCSTSLEMGIDIGFIDLVVMISAPKGVSRALQRIGRSGHAVNETSRAVLVASNINDLTECAVTAKMIEARRLELVRIPTNAADVLAQHIVGLAIPGDMTEDEIFELIRRAYPYRSLSREKFEGVLRYLEGGGASLEKQYTPVFGKIVRENGIIRLPHPRIARDFYQNVGTISTEHMVQVKVKGRRIGQVEQSFIQRLNVGDVFVLSGRSLRLIETRLLDAKAEWAGHDMPTVPRWNANKMPLASGLAEEVVKLRSKLGAMLEAGNDGAITAVEWLVEEYELTATNAEALVRQFLAQLRVSSIPAEGDLLIELYQEGPLRHLFFHSLIGRSANDALSRIIAWRVKKLRGGNALVTIDDYGFLMTLRGFQMMEVEEWKEIFSPDGAEQDLTEALTESQLVKWQFRGVAQTGLMVPRRQFGRERSGRNLQWSTEIIFEVLQKYEPSHPMLAEAYYEAAHTFLDLPRALDFLRRARSLKWRPLEVPKVSPFAFGIFVSKIKESMMMEDPEAAIERLYHEFYQDLEKHDVPLSR
jgi:ATP-dependent helicase Lhr and Lhr-like helicase